MKRYLILLALLLCSAVVLFAQTEELPDTVWTKFTYPNKVNAVKFTPDGKYLASGGDDGIPKLWNAETGELVREFLGNETPIYSMDLNNTGELIAGVNGSSIITIWNVQNGEIVKVIDQYEGQNTNKKQGLSIEFSHNGTYLAAMLMHDGAWYPEIDIFLWNTKDWKIISERKDLPVTSSLTFSPDDSFLAVSNYVVGESQITVGILEVPSLKIFHIIEGSSNYGIEQCAFSPDGKYLAAAISNSPNKVWNTTDWNVFNEFGSDAISVAFSPDSKYVIFGENRFQNARVIIWDILLKQEKYKYRLDWVAKKNWDMDEGDNPIDLDIDNNSKRIVVAGSLGLYMLNAKWNPTSVQVNPIQITEPTVFPNPTNQTANIRFNLIRPSEVNIGIFDINSKEIVEIHNGFLDEGIKDFIWNTSSVLSGTYFAKITANGNISTIKIIVNK